MPIETYLKIQAAGEFALGIIFLAWFIKHPLPLRIAAALAAFEMISILFFVGIDTITFRDIGILGTALALFLFSFQPTV